jgi:hypothetical protein
MSQGASTAYELLARVAILPIRILSSSATEEPDFSAQRVRVKMLREDVDDGALALIFALAVLSFHDARPRGTSDIDYVERDEWTLDDLYAHLRFAKGALCLDIDYVRGRMMKTRMMIWPTGIVEIDTTNRHQMATRWIETLKGKKHLRLASGGSEPARRPAPPIICAYEIRMPAKDRVVPTWTGRRGSGHGRGESGPFGRPNPLDPDETRGSVTLREESKRLYSKGLRTQGRIGLGFQSYGRHIG